MSKVIRAKKKPVKITVMQFSNRHAFSSALHIFSWAGGNVFYVPEGYEHPLRRDSEKDRSTTHVLADAPEFLVIHTLEGPMRADKGDYIARGVQGEYYPIKPDIFSETYDVLASNGN